MYKQWPYSTFLLHDVLKRFLNGNIHTYFWKKLDVDKEKNSYLTHTFYSQNKACTEINRQVYCVIFKVTS